MRGMRGRMSLVRRVTGVTGVTGVRGRSPRRRVPVGGDAGHRYGHDRRENGQGD
jgi:hypothetical protein